MADELVIGGVTFSSRLIVGTGRHRSMQEMVDSLEASGTQMVTVAIRRLDLDNPEQNILEHINLDKYRILPKHGRLPHRGRSPLRRPPGS